jgi:hypothetical protein
LAVPASAHLGFTFEYGEVTFTLPQGFLLARLFGTEEWSSIDDTLDVLWADWRGAIRTNGAAWSDIHAVIGCYNLEVDPDQYLFWNEGWGAPHRLLLNALQMLVVFNEHIDDQESGNACGMGTGFRDMIRNLLTGKPAYRSELTYESGTEGTLIEDFRIHFLSIDDRFRGVDDSGQECNVSPDGSATGCGIPFDSWEEDTRSGRVGPYYVAEGYHDSGTSRPYYGSYETDRNGAPKSDCGFGANVPGSTRDRIRMQPAMLDFGGWLNDYLLFWARVALDYYYETGDIAYFMAADSLGRHVLAQILQWAGHITHEMGHVYCGGDHCCASGLFQEHARGRLLCGARAKLGLYVDSVDLSPSDTGTNANIIGNDGCNISDNLATYTDANSAGEYTGQACCSLRSDGSCISHAQQLCRIGDGVSPFIHAGSYDEWFFCRSRCTAGTQSTWDATICSQVQVTGATLDIEVRMDGFGITVFTDRWNSCGVP